MKFTFGHLIILISATSWGQSTGVTKKEKNVGTTVLGGSAAVAWASTYINHQKGADLEKLGYWRTTIPEEGLSSRAKLTSSIHTVQQAEKGTVIKLKTQLSSSANRKIHIKRLQGSISLRESVITNSKKAIKQNMPWAEYCENRFKQPKIPLNEFYAKQIEYSKKEIAKTKILIRQARNGAPIEPIIFSSDYHMYWGEEIGVKAYTHEEVIEGIAEQYQKGGSLVSMETTLSPAERKLWGNSISKAYGLKFLSGFAAVTLTGASIYNQMTGDVSKSFKSVANQFNGERSYDEDMKIEVVNQASSIGTNY